MKMTKVLFGAAVLAMVFGFASCKAEDDDPFDLISGSNKTYTISGQNTGASGTIRGYESTTFKHKGELFQVAFDSLTDDGVIGFIWDLPRAAAESGNRNFLIFGIRNKKGAFSYYTSKFFHVTDMQAINFGAADASGITTAYQVTTNAAGLAAEGAKELDITNILKGTTFKTLSTPTKGSDNKYSYWVDIYQLGDSDYKGPNKTTAVADTASKGAFQVDIYSADPSDGSVSANKLDSFTIGTDYTGYNRTDGVSQGYLAVYANIQPSSSLNGSVYLKTNYAAAETIEEDAE